MGAYLVAGCGDVGTGLALRLARGGHRAFGLRRDPAVLPDRIHPVAADLTDRAGLAGALTDLPALAGVAVTVTAGERSEEAYRRTYLGGATTLLDVLAEQGRDPRIVVASSTAVYGVLDGSWVDEDTPTEPTSPTGAVLVETEEAVAAAAHEHVHVRLSGIYGPGRTRLLDRVRAGTATYPPRVRYTNRIHRDDAAGVLHHALLLEDPAPVYVASDHDPAPLREVLRYLAQLVGAPEPAEARDGREGANKRCRNDRLVASGYSFRYRTFREGYAALVDTLS